MSNSKKDMKLLSESTYIFLDIEAIEEELDDMKFAFDEIGLQKSSDRIEKIKIMAEQVNQRLQIHIGKLTNLIDFKE